MDTREQTPLIFSRLPFEVRGLPTADYSIRGLEGRFAVERKTIQDFVACCVGESRARFESELTRLRGYEFRRLLIVGTPDDITAMRYRSLIQARSVWATLHTFEMRYSLPYLFSATPERAAEQVEMWAAWYWRERMKELESLIK